MVTFIDWALLRPLFLALIVPGTFIAKRDAPDIYKLYILVSRTLMGSNHRTATHHRRCPQWKVQDLGTHADHEMTSNHHPHPTACHLPYPHLITISTWISTLLTLIGIMHHPVLMMTPNQDKVKTLHHLGIGGSRLLILHMLLELIIPQ